MNKSNEIPDVHDDPVDRKQVLSQKLQAIAILVAVAVIAARALDWI